MQKNPLIYARLSLQVPYRKKKSWHKILSVKKPPVKKFVTGKIIRHFSETKFFDWLSENIN